MRTRFWIIGIIVLAVGLWLLLHKPTQHQKIALPEQREVVTNDSHQTRQGRQPKASEKHERASISIEAVPAQPSGIERSNVIREQMKADWQKPIEFYGRVVDDNSNAVAGASIRFRWADMTENVNTSTTQSDMDGLFSLHGKLGRSLHVWVSKEGYYASHGGEESFIYSLANDIFSPDPENPIVFKLKKKGQGAQLITSENGFRLKVDVRVPRDNTPVRVDFLQKQASNSGQLEISQIKPPWQQATEWSFRMSIPEGGLVENQDEFQFEAPEANYQQTVEYQFAKSETNWVTHVTKQFYVTFGQPRKYGWLRLESDLSQETVFLTYAINPSGSRNLEPVSTGQ